MAHRFTQVHYRHDYRQVRGYLQAGRGASSPAYTPHALRTRLPSPSGVASCSSPRVPPYAAALRNVSAGPGAARAAAATHHTRSAAETTKVRGGQHLGTGQELT